MKQKLLTRLLLLLFFYSPAQVIDIPDLNFKNVLVNSICASTLPNGSGPNHTNVDLNNNGEIEVSEAMQITGLSIENAGVLDFSGLENFLNLKAFNCYGNEVSTINLNFINSITNLSIQNNPNLDHIQASEIQEINEILLIKDNPNLTNLDLSGIPSINATNVQIRGNNSLNSIDLSSLQFAGELGIFDSAIETLDLNSLISIGSKFIISNNDSLNNLIIPNLIESGQITITNNDNLQLLAMNTLNNIFDTNSGGGFGDGRLEIINNPNLAEINLSNLNYVDLFIGIRENSVLENLNLTSLSEIGASLRIEDGSLEHLDLSNLITLGDNFTYSNNILNSIDLSSLTHIVGSNGLPRSILASNANITSIDLSSISVISILGLSDNLLTEIDLSSGSIINHIFLEGNNLNSFDLNSIENNTLRLENNDLVTLFLKNGDESSYINIDFNPNIEFICVDENELNQIQNLVDENNYENVVINSYCSFAPGGVYYEILGDCIVDLDLNGCNLDDTHFPYMRFDIDNGEEIGIFYGSDDGTYNIPLPEGSYAITPILENPDYFIVEPSSFMANFMGDSDSLAQNICLTPNGIYNDIEVSILPLEQAVPGFETNYQLFFKNKGNTTLNGSITLNFDENYMDFIIANPNQDNQTEGQLTWEYTNLEPFESRAINFTMNLNTPTDDNFPLNADDIIEFVAAINPISNDETPDDNIFELNQIVVNSFDPNDKTCLEGISITENQVGDFVHYLIRFENLGTANATNVVVKDIIDINLFDINSLIPLHASHSFTTRINNINEIEFIFENINLPFDDDNNDGFVVFKIKTSSELQINDTFDNDAEIYFDYNFPIVTDNYLTTIESTLNLNEYNFDKPHIHPNPVQNSLFINSDKTIKAISIFNVHGQVIKSFKFNSNTQELKIDMGKFNQGVYFLNVITEKGEYNSKIIKD